ncbi:hypothetical protein HZC07_01445, partial [Candidatus Micrarchaeota archaeon]|nr:hypothetical protein [Candidatus Micrarchaeota archaeon]
AGNIVLGNSSNTTNCNRCVNVNYALECQDMYDGKYIAYSSSMRNANYSFGIAVGGDTEFCIKTLENYHMVRCMETVHINTAADCYFCASLENCTNCIFSFNQRSKHYLIGNLQLTKEKYAELKSKILTEVGDELKRKKRVTSIIEIISGARND